MFNLNAEVRFPLPFIKNLGGVVFQDMGALSGDRLADFKAQNLLTPRALACGITPLWGRCVLILDGNGKNMSLLKGLMPGF